MNTDIQFNRHGNIGVITLDRPESLNSLSLEGVQLLLQTLRSASGDSTLKALIVTGAGRGFCAGWQLDEAGVPGLPEESFGVRQAHLMEDISTR